MDQEVPFVYTIGKLHRKLIEADRKDERRENSLHQVGPDAMGVEERAGGLRV